MLSACGVVMQPQRPLRSILFYLFLVHDVREYEMCCEECGNMVLTIDGSDRLLMRDCGFVFCTRPVGALNAECVLGVFFCECV